MHRWHFQRLFRWLVPTLVFIVLLCQMVARQKGAAGGLTFLDDAAYGNMAVARTIVEHAEYGIAPGQRMPAVRDTLWNLLLAFVAMIFRDPAPAAYFLGALFALSTVLILLRLARLLFPFPPFIIYTAVLLILSPGFLATGISGTSASLTMMLATAAVLLHVEGLFEKRSPLSVGCALVVGLLLWIRIEFALLWIIFSLHALIVSFVRRSKDTGPVFVVTRAMTGALVVLFCLFPLVAWNYQVVFVPWPQAMGAPLTMDAMASGGGSVFALYGGMVKPAVSEAFARLHENPFMVGGLERFMAWFGFVLIAILGYLQAEERPYSIGLFAAVVLPPLYALVYPYLGWSGAHLVFLSLQPLCVLSACFAFFRVPFLIESLYRKWKPGLPAAPGFMLWWLVMGSILALLALGRGCARDRARNDDVRSVVGIRESLARTVQGLGAKPRLVMTDAPGWPAFALEVPVLDLTGDYTPSVLAALGADGGVDPGRLTRLLASEKPDMAVIWNPANRFALKLAPCRDLKMEVPTGILDAPAVCEITWPAAP